MLPSFLPHTRTHDWQIQQCTPLCFSDFPSGQHQHCGRKPLPLCVLPAVPSPASSREAWGRQAPQPQAGCSPALDRSSLVCVWPYTARRQTLSHSFSCLVGLVLTHGLSSNPGRISSCPPCRSQVRGKKNRFSVGEWIISVSSATMLLVTYCQSSPCAPFCKQAPFPLTVSMLLSIS